MFTGSISCTEGYLGRSLTIVIFPYQSGQVSSIGYFPTENLFVVFGATSDFRAEGTLATAEEGQCYFAVPYDDQTQISSNSEIVIFTVSKSSGVETIDAVAPIRTSIFNLSGVKVMETDRATPLPSPLRRLHPRDIILRRHPHLFPHLPLILSQKTITRRLCQN